jgi:hypothetical protein
MRMIGVFISSKQAELSEDRLIVANTINTLANMQAVMAENWAPQREVVHQVYVHDVLRCPIYIGLFWKVFSGPTVREYEAALSNKHTEILLYVKECADEERDEQLRALIRRFNENHVPKRYRSGAELMTLLPTHLHAAVERMVQTLVQLGATARSAHGPRELRARREQESVIEAWDLAGEPDAIMTLLNETKAALGSRLNLA